jgi:hypothetical protein
MILAIFITTLFATNPLLSQERLPVDFIPTKSVPSIDYASLIEEDLQREQSGLPFRFAQPNSVSITPATHGLWKQLDGGWGSC